MNQKFTVIEIGTRDRASGSDPIPAHDLPGNMVRVFVGRDASLEMALAALDHAKSKLAAGDRLTITPDMTNTARQ